MLNRLSLAIAALLLTLQGVVIFLDFFAEIWVFDEVLSFSINAALVLIIARLRKALRVK